MIERVRRKLAADAVLVVLSQVPPGFTRALAACRRTRLYYQVETLVFGRAVERATKPERFIVGCADPRQPAAAGACGPLLEAFGCPILPMRLRERRARQDHHQLLPRRIDHASPTPGRTLRADRRRLVGDRAGAEARPAHRAVQPISRPASASPAAISSATLRPSCSIGRGEKDRRRRGQGVARQQSRIARDWPCAACCRTTMFERQARRRRSRSGAWPTRKTRIRSRTRRRSRCSHICAEVQAHASTIRWCRLPRPPCDDGRRRPPGSGATAPMR